MSTPELAKRQSKGDAFLVVLLAATAAAFAYMLWSVFHNTPSDATLGFVQKIFYVHLPPAIYGYVGFTVCFVASLYYLIRPRPFADAIARTGAAVGVLFCGLVLIAGPLWAKKSWGTFWTGEPRLVLTLALFVIFLSYVLVRSFGGDSELTKRIGAILAIFGFADIPLVRSAVERSQGGNHPMVVTGEGGGISAEMWYTLGTAFVAFGLLFVALLILRMRQAVAVEQIKIIERDIADRALLLEDYDA